MLRRLQPALRHLGRDRSGVAFTEFALALPVLLTLGLGGLEVAHYALAVEECSQIAMTAADDASRVRIQIDETNVNDVMTGAKLIGDNIGFRSHGRIILSDVELNSANTYQWIRWQRCAGAKSVASSYGTPLTASGTPILDGTELTKPSSEAKFTSTAIGPAGNQIAAADNTGLMFVQVTYDYQPLISNIWIGGAKTITTTSAFNVRQRTDQTLYNSTSLPASGLSACSILSA